MITITNTLSRNNVKVLGNGTETIMMAPGFGGDQNAFRYMDKAFSNKYKIVLFDYVGTGKSDYSAYDSIKYSTLRGFAQDVLDICETLELSDVIFIGHSVSSMIGVLAALERPDYFKKLILLGPSACYQNIGDYKGGLDPDELEALFEVMDNNYQGWARAMAPAVMGNPDRPELGESFIEDWIDYDPEIARNFARATFLSDNRTLLPNLTVPSLSIICDEDILASIEAIKYINEHAPNNTVVHLDAAGHCPHLSSPDKVVEAITDYLAV